MCGVRADPVVLEHLLGVAVVGRHEADPAERPDGVSPHTAHTTNPVPLIVTEKGLKVREDGELADLAPTVLGLLGFAQPLQMGGENLIADG